MPLSIKELQEATRKVRTEYLSQPLTITYRLGAINEELGDWLEKHGQERGSISKMIEKVVVEWDVVDDEGEPTPPTAETIHQYGLPTPFLNHVLTVVLGDVVPGKS